LFSKLFIGLTDYCQINEEIILPHSIHFLIGSDARLSREMSRIFLINSYFFLNFSVNDPANIPAGSATIPILENADIIANTFPNAVIG